MRTTARTWYALILFGLGVACLVHFKPGFMFREDGSMYEFGTGHDRSVFTLGTAAAALAVVSSFAFAMGDLFAATSPARPSRPVVPPARTWAAPANFFSLDSSRTAAAAAPAAATDPLFDPFEPRAPVPRGAGPVT